ncbi:MAG: hypothetical protein JWM62_2232 [Frankiales bacterium]|nr:hypothetical protein [Frankiales bacterium]
MIRRVQLLFLAALVGVLVCLGLGVHALAGTVPALAYAVIALALLLVGAARARAAAEAARRATGRTCTCCTTSQHDPVKVI